MPKSRAKRNYKNEKQLARDMARATGFPIKHCLEALMIVHELISIHLVQMDREHKLILKDYATFSLRPRKRLARIPVRGKKGFKALKESELVELPPGYVAKAKFYFDLE